MAAQTYTIHWVTGDTDAHLTLKEAEDLCAGLNLIWDQTGKGIVRQDGSRAGSIMRDECD